MAEIDQNLLRDVEALFKHRSKPDHIPFFFGPLVGLDTDDPGEPTNVFLVDGDKIRVETNMDFVSGNNSEESPDYVVDLNGGDCGAIYLDDKTTPDQWIPNCYHEAKEYSLMCGGMTYEKAHEQANEEEKMVRMDMDKTSMAKHYMDTAAKGLRPVNYKDKKGEGEGRGGY